MCSRSKKRMRYLREQFGVADSFHFLWPVEVVSREELLRRYSRGIGCRIPFAKDTEKEVARVLDGVNREMDAHAKAEHRCGENGQP